MIGPVCIFLLTPHFDSPLLETSRGLRYELQNQGPFGSPEGDVKTGGKIPLER
jgi:hypothetical protein